MAFDARRGRAVPFGGAAAGQTLGDLWEWDGASWQRVSFARGPSPRQGHVMVWDARRERVVVTAGRDTAGAWPDDVWQWDAARWTEVVASGAALTGRERAAGAYSTQRGELVIFGGARELALDDTWILATEAGARPGLLFTVDWAAALAETSDLRQLTLSMTAGATGHTTGAGLVDGFEILAWSWWRGRWRHRGSSSRSGTSPGATQVDFGSPDDLAEHLGPDGRFSFLLRPIGRYGAGAPPIRLAIDRLEARIDYRH